ncbi:hypothetical protein HMPREF0663_10808 [Hoylesella oralis ATCC 33269]|uniref:Uncharacterized protein n=1 Tax=Hoylesella oralis ATCC 33269 TaxID=873533 RepID=E7RNQ7_9BACT|nr:hypothetical protein HMPREF0663_10808 [Hoylesella oralis ATCC 33269]
MYSDYMVHIRLQKYDLIPENYTFHNGNVAFLPIFDMPSFMLFLPVPRFQSNYSFIFKRHFIYF